MMKKSVATTILIFLAIFSLVALFSFNPSKYTNRQKTNKTAPATKTTAPAVESAGLIISDNGKTVSYNGQNGKNALDLLSQNTTIQTEQTSFGPMVKAINGVTATDKEFWLFSVNGQPAAVGAADYQTKDSDIIEWRLSGI